MGANQDTFPIKGELGFFITCEKQLLPNSEYKINRDTLRRKPS
jgi:hypothetical protein